MRVSDIDVVQADDHCELRAFVESDAHPDHYAWFAPFTLWYRFPTWCAPLLDPENGDPFVAALLLPAMRLGEPLRIPTPVSSQLLASAPEIQAVYASFDPRATRVAVEATARNWGLPAPDGESSVGLYFSMGVDSFYSLLKNLRDHPDDDQTVTHLISLHGFDVVHGDWDERFPSALLNNFRRVAAETNKTFVPVVTNIRRHGARLAPWFMLHGGALASVALALGARFRRVTIASWATYDMVHPWGSHPALDPLWSTETVAFIHDGCELNRIDKTRFIAGSSLALETLRVCPGYQDTTYNCGRCIKCLRTMIDLQQAGVLDRCRTLPHEIDPELLRVALRMPVGPVHVADFRRRLANLEATGGSPRLREVLVEHLAEVADRGQGS